MKYRIVKITYIDDLLGHVVTKYDIQYRKSIFNLWRMHNPLSIGMYNDIKSAVKRYNKLMYGVKITEVKEDKE
jgi:hypothetical protein